MRAKELIDKLKPRLSKEQISNNYWELRYQFSKLWYRSFGRVVDWPPSPGRFVIGNSDSAVAVCTLSSTALIEQISPKRVAIIGRIYTPNLGVEKMIRNVVSNPKLRYLVLCGKESPVFKVGEALLKLAENGVDEQGRIIGATADNAELTNLPREAIETFRQQIQLIDHIGEMRPGVIDRVIAELDERHTPPFAVSGLRLSEGSAADSAAPVEIVAQRRHWLELDPVGYFILHLDREHHEIVAERYTGDKRLTHIFRGRAADLLYHAILKEKLVSQYEHAAYLGAELAKAETALYNNLLYEQDRKLNLNHKIGTKEDHLAHS
jgi:tetrahydromethanopterin S-methyltransferase subunit A